MGFLDRLRGTPPPSRPGVGLVASAKVLEPSDQMEQTRIRRGAEQWQRQAWDGYDELEVVSFPANYQANALSRVRLLPAVQDDPREPPVPLDPDGDDDLTDVDEATRAAMFATLNRLGSGPVDLDEIQRLLALNLFIAGDCYLAGYEDKGEEVWDIISVDEMVVGSDGRGFARRSPGGGAASQESFPENAFICRLWQRHPRYSRWAYSSMRSILGLTDELRVLTDSIHASATSRMPAGVLALSRNFLAGSNDQTLTGQPAEAANDPTVQAFIQHFETPVKSRRSSSSVVPFLLFGDLQDVKEGIQKIEFNRDVDTIYATMRAELIQRIAIGLDLPAEILTGKGDANHWSAWQVAEETFKYHLEPDTQLMVNSLTQGYFRPHLTKMGIENPSRYCIWYDATPLLAHPNQAQDYQDAYDRIEVSGDAYRRSKNIPDGDKPEPSERAERYWAKTLEGARTAPIVFPTPAQIEAGEIPSLDTGNVGTVSGAPTEVVNDTAPASPETTTKGPASTAPPSVQAAVTLPPLAALVASAGILPLGPRLAHIESALRLRLLQAADDHMARTLEKAGNRLRSLANKGGAQLRTKIAGADPLDVASLLGPDTVAKLATSTDDLLDGAFVGLGASWTTWVRRAQEQAITGIAEFGDLTETDAENLTAEMTTNREEGWAVLHASMLALAARLLYDPHVPPPEKGEWADFTVPPGLIRDALSKAGGGPERGDISDLLNGATVHGAFSDAGLEVTGFTWLHGDPARDFEPHAELDGLSFTGDDDPELLNTEDWPDTEYWYPGDHPGCTCSRVEAISRAEEATA